jgi:hypothetical protein
LQINIYPHNLADNHPDGSYGPGVTVSGGNDTTDKIFILSIEEVVQYFGDSGQLANFVITYTP